MKRILFPILFLAALVSAQEYRGAISGSVTDPSGSAIAKASVVATETRTGVKSTAVSEDSGAYNLPFLAPGIYDISAEAPGFKKFVRQGINLSSSGRPVIDIRLEVGAVNDSVTITADAPLLDTSSPSVGQVITTEEVEAFPINGRTPMMLGNLAMGVVSTFEPGPVRPFDNGAPNSISIGGAPSGRNEVLINGAPNAGFSNQMAYSPMQDAVQEVRVNTFEMDAAYGHTMGGTVNMVTKSGTNSLHGAAYIFNQTSVLDANSFFNNARGVTIPSYHQNQWGITGGGPVYVPKVFNGKNRVFWYFGWEGMRDSDPANSPLETGNPVNFTSVPTAAERQGDFSALLKVPGANSYQIYDPATGVLQGTLVSRQPFPGNIIPASRINSIAKNYLNYFPLPNTTGLADGRQNYLVNAIDADGYDNELGRLDVSVSNRDKLSFDMHHNFRNQDKNNYFHNEATGNFLYRINQGAVIDNVFTVTPSVVTDIRASWTRYQEHHFAPADNVDPASLGFPSSLVNQAQFRTMPYLVFASTSISAGARSGFEPLGYNGDGTNFNDIFQLFGDVVKIRGNHTIKVGADFRENRWSAYTFGNPSGTFTFTGNWTNSPAVANSTIFGQELAAFLLGLPNSGSIDANAQTTVQSRYMAFFVNDDWRIRPNLTINFGLRFERDTPEIEWHNKSVNGFDPAATNPVSAQAAANYATAPNPLLPASQFKALGGLTFTSAGSPNIYNPQSHILSPRFGFSWSPTKLGRKWVFRGGLGVLTDPIQTPSPNSPGFSQTTQMATSSNLPPYVATLSDPFPNGILAPTGAAKGTGTFIGQSISYYNPAIRNPYTVRWQFSLQRQLPGQFVLELAYIGSHTMHQPVNTSINFVPQQYLSKSLVRDNATITQLTGLVTNPFKGLLPNSSALNGSTVALQQLLVPYPEFPASGITLQANNVGSSYFQSFNARLQKRFTHGLTLMNNFIWNRLEDRLAFINESDPGPKKRISSDSRPLRDVLASTYQLPIGRGRRLNLAPRWLDFVAGGWGLSGILTLQSGPTLGWGNYIYYGGPLNLDPHQPNGVAFDTTQFNTVTNQQLANNVRYFDNQFNNLRRDLTKQMDLTMSKKFTFMERRYFEFRIEAFNATNRVTFGNPNTSPTNTAFGTIGSQANTPRRIESGLRLVW